MNRSLFRAGVAIAAMLTAAAASAQPPAAPPGQAPQAGARPPGPPAGMQMGSAGAIQKVAENLYVIPGGGGNTTVWVTARGVLLVDTKVTGQGQAILDQVKTVTDKPILYIVNTHSHFDHTGSNAFFPETVEIVAQENLAKQLEEQASRGGAPSPEARRGLVDKTYKDKLTLFSGDEAVDLYNFGPAHTSGDSLVVFRKARVMAAGDVFAWKGQPIIDTRGGGSGIAYPDFVAKAVATIKDVDIVIPGHSPVMKWQDFVDFGEFNRLLLEHARESLKAGKTPLEAMESFRPKLPEKFAGYQLGRGMMTGPGGNFEPIYAELQKAAGLPVTAPQGPGPGPGPGPAGPGPGPGAGPGPGPGGPGPGPGGGPGGGPRGGPAALFGPGFNASQTFQQTCAVCHTAEGMTIGDRQAHSAATLKTLPTERVYQTLATGTMAMHVAGLTDKDRRTLAAFVAGKPFADAGGLGVKSMTNACAANPPLGALNAKPSWLGWSAAATNGRFQPAAAAGLTAADVPNLKLKWAFGIPNGGIMSGQPTVAFGRVFVASDNNHVYSMDAKTGCVYWAFDAGSSGRFAPVVGPISGHPGSSYAVFFATGPGHTFAVDAHSGKQLWKTSLTNRVTNANGTTRELNSVTASVAYHDGRVYVPFVGSETFYNPNAECCRSRGSLAAVDANTGTLVWRSDTIPEPATELGKTASGVPIWGKSGASVWNTPTIDARRQRVYVGTGNSYGPVAADTSDSIIAFDMKDGKIAWHHQEFKGDAFMASFGPGGCGPTNPAGGACPEKMGPDWDFGGSSAILATLASGKQVLLAAGKGGVAIALDPDKGGERIWRTPLFTGEPPSPLGLVMWGGSFDGQRVYYALQRPGGGLTALDAATGAAQWTADVKADRRGQSGAVSSIPGVAFTGGWDGILRAVDAKGNVIWTFDTAKSYPTVNGIPAKGGALGVPGPAIAGGTLYVASGYNGIQGGAGGNILLAFSAR